MSRFTLVLALAGSLSAGIALAADITVRQKGSTFDQEKVTVRVGEEIVFLNDDRVAHNVMSASGGNKFNLGLQKPGDSQAIAFEKAGRVDVRCAIHPKMKMVIEVTE
ncbi:plastocyanin/azurin family copper-binding protein [Marinibaculum pumilum]|uniref:Plastocyanin/azurin family copper-binding protein n=1 Tax=Marinibaculum pumilum TaxID=1766165 RepID=A0ABV7L328_9PROT